MPPGRAICSTTTCSNGDPGCDSTLRWNSVVFHDEDGIVVVDFDATSQLFISAPPLPDTSCEGSVRGGQISYAGTLESVPGGTRVSLEVVSGTVGENYSCLPGEFDMDRLIRPVVSDAFANEIESYVFPCTL
jgi:hypothetical protein